MLGWLLQDLGAAPAAVPAVAPSAASSAAPRTREPHHPWTALVIVARALSFGAVAARAGIDGHITIAGEDS